MKKLWYFLFPLFVCLILPLPNASAANGDTHTENGFIAVERADGFLNITAYEAPRDENGDLQIPEILEIPATIDGLEVRQISSLFTADQSAQTVIKEVRLPEGLQILSGARNTGVFRNCTALESVHIPSTLETAGYPFVGCGNLKNVEFGASLPRVPATLFYGCTGLEEISLPSMTTVVEKNAFRGCSNLKKIIFHSGNYLTEIQESAFQGCTSLTSGVTSDLASSAEDVLTLPAGLRTVGKSAFTGCVALKGLKTPEGLRTLGESAFANCTALETVRMSEGALNVGASAFAGCTALKTVRMSEGLQTLGDSAFANCSNLSGVLIPASLTTAGSADYPVFSGCSSLNDVRFLEGATSIVANLFAQCSGLKKIVPGAPFNENESLGNGASGLQAPPTIVSIGSGAFTHSGVTSIEIPNSVTSYGARAFQNCESLTTAQISDMAPVIPERMFYQCYFLESLNVNPMTVTSIGKEAFYECKRLTTLPAWGALSSIGASAFRRCEALPSISLPNVLTSIGANAFQNDAMLTNVVIPSMITAIPKYAFAQCSRLADIIIPPSVKTIADHAFYQDTDLLRVRIPATVDTINEDAFSYVDRMTIEGDPGSYAEDWARRNGAREFVDVSVPIETISLAGGADSMILPRNGVIAPVFDIQPADSTDALTLTSSKPTVVGVQLGYALYCETAFSDPVTITATATSGKTYSFTVTCENLTGLETPAPEVTQYAVGDSMDWSGFTPKAVFQSGARQPIYNYPPNADTISKKVLAWSAEELDSESPGSKTVKVSYGRFSSEIPVEVFASAEEIPVSLRRVEGAEDGESVRVWTHGVAGDAKYCALVSFDADGVCLGVEFRALSDADTAAGFADFSVVPEMASVKAILLNNDTLAPAWDAKTFEAPPKDESENENESENAAP